MKNFGFTISLGLLEIVATALDNTARGIRSYIRGQRYDRHS